MSCPEGLDAGFGTVSAVQRAICYIRSDFGSDTTGHGLYRLGTGLLIATSDTASSVLTAAHVLYSNEVGRAARKVELWFACYGQSYQADRIAHSIRFPDAFAGSDDDAAHDFGLAIIDRLDPSTFAPVAISTSRAAPHPVRIVGYPSEDSCAGTRQPYHADLTAVPAGDNWTYDQLTYEGMSGGPLLASDGEDGPFSYGIHIRAASDVVQAMRFSDAVVSRLEQWL